MVTHLSTNWAHSCLTSVIRLWVTAPCHQLYQTHDDSTDAIIAFASRSVRKAKSHYPAHKLEFLTLKWAVVEKFHEYLYGLNFDIYTDNNPLTYVLTMAKLDAASNCWVGSLANYNFQLYYQAGKTNIDMDTLFRVSWRGCMPDTADTHIQVTATAVWAIQEATLKGSMILIEAYSNDLHILDAIEDGPQVACMTIDDWHQAQHVDLALNLVITRLQDGTLSQHQLKKLILLNYNSSLGSATTSSWGKAFSIGRVSSKNPKRPYSS